MELELGHTTTIIFASGTKGKHVRANAAGGTLARGGYVKDTRRGGYGLVRGPFRTKTEANLLAYGTHKET